MPCPNCDSTFIPLGCCVVTGVAVHYCVRCGTVKPCDQPVDDLVVPDLVRRCREFEKWIVEILSRKIGDIPTGIVASEWHRLGIAEAIHLPKDRKL